MEPPEELIGALLEIDPVLDPGPNAWQVWSPFSLQFFFNVAIGLSSVSLFLFVGLDSSSPIVTDSFEEEQGSTATKSSNMLEGASPLVLRLSSTTLHARSAFGELLLEQPLPAQTSSASFGLTCSIVDQLFTFSTSFSLQHAPDFVFSFPSSLALRFVPPRTTSVIYPMRLYSTAPCSSQVREALKPSEI